MGNQMVGVSRFRGISKKKDYPRNPIKFFGISSHGDHSKQLEAPMSIHLLFVVHRQIYPKKEIFWIAKCGCDWKNYEGLSQPTAETVKWTTRCDTDLKFNNPEMVIWGLEYVGVVRKARIVITAAFSA
jgi:hypothetical protein